MKVFVAADHRGFEIKGDIIKYLEHRGIETEDSGDKKLNPNDDFPVFAAKACNDLLASNDNDARAILVCGSGQGMVMAANRIRGIRAGLGWSRKAAKDVRNDEDANVLAIPSELYYQDSKLVLNIIDDFLKTHFAGASRYVRRNKELDEI